MPLKDEQHKLARIVKDLDRRLSNIEETSRTAPTPNLLTSVNDTVAVDDSVATVRSKAVEPLLWGGGPADDRGWGTSSWGRL